MSPTSASLARMLSASRDPCALRRATAPKLIAGFGSRRRICAASVLVLPSIAQPIHRIDAVESGIGRQEFAPHALHVRGDRAVVDDDVRLGHELIPVLDMAGEFGERMRKPEF